MDKDLVRKILIVLSVFALFGFGATVVELVIKGGANWADLSISASVLGLFIACAFGE